MRQLAWRPGTVGLALLATACSTQGERPSKQPVEHVAPAGDSDRALFTGRTVVSGGEVPAIVILEPRHDAALPEPAGPAVMDQIGRTFIPPVVFARVDDAAEFRNSDEELHNINVKDAATRDQLFNVVVPTGEKYLYTFKHAGVFDVSCDVHAGMWAVIVVTTTPYAVVARPDGTFEIPDVVAGPYAMTIYAGATTIERNVEVVAPRTEVGLAGPP